MQRIINANVMPMEGPRFERGYVEFENGVVRAVGPMEDITPGESDYDADGGYALPGIVEAHCHLGLRREGDDFSAADSDERTEAIAAHVNARDGIYPMDQGIANALRSGVTTAVVSPGSACLIGGQISAIKTWGACVDRMLISSLVGMKAALGEPILAPRGAKQVPPITRSGAALMLREAFEDAVQYGEKKRAGQEVYDKKMDALLPVVNGEIPLFLRALRCDDIATALRITKPYPIRLVLLHAYDWQPVRNDIQARGIPVIAGPLLINPWDRLNEHGGKATPDIPAKFHEAGVDFCISCFDASADLRPVPVWYWQLHTAAAVNAGLPEDRALRAITIDAARLTGLDGRVGSLRPGKDADIVVFSGRPLDYRTGVKAVFIDGVRRV